MNNGKNDFKRIDKFKKNMDEKKQKSISELNTFRDMKYEDIMRLTQLEEKLEQIRHDRNKLSFRQKINRYYDVMQKIQTEEDIEKVVECLLEEKTPRKIAIKLVDKFENNQNKLVDIALGEMLYKSTEKMVRDREYKKRRMEEELNKAMGIRIVSEKGLDYSDGDPKNLLERAFLNGVYNQSKYNYENRKTKS
jgi:hypothetical protein